VAYFKALLARREWGKQTTWYLDQKLTANALEGLDCRKHKL